MEHNHALLDHTFFARGYEWIGLPLWPHKARGVFRGPFRHAAGALTPLVIGVTHDPATPYKWTKRFVADLGNARLVTYRGDGHLAVTDSNPCVLSVYLSYFDEGTLPPPGTTSRQQVPEPAAARASSSGARGKAWKKTVIRAAR